MLGLGRASQYAGWWNGKPKASFSASSAVTTLSNQDPQFSYLDDGSISTNGGVVGTGSYDITGLTGFTGYSGYNATCVYHVYLPSSNWTSGLSAQTAGAIGVNQLLISGTTYYYNSSVAISSAGALTFDWAPGNGNNTLTTPLGYTNYRDKWLTFVGTSSSTSTSFTSWAASGTGNQFIRVALFDTQTGDLIVKNDTATSFGTSIPLGSLPSTIGSTTTGSATNGMASNDFAQNGRTWYKAGHWATIGQMFDPLTTTDKTWLTPSPNAIIANAKAWLNVRYINTTLDGSSNYNIPTDSQDLYSQSGNLKWKFNNSNTYWSTNSSTTTIVRNT